MRQASTARGSVILDNPDGDLQESTIWVYNKEGKVMRHALDRLQL